MYIKGEMCAFILSLSTLLASSRPHHKSKRSIVKDYLNPLTYPTAAVQFEKGEDGKYYPHMIDSKVEYALAKSLADMNVITKDDVEPTDSKDDKQKEVAKDVLEDLSKVASGITAKPHVEDASKDTAKVIPGLLSVTANGGFGPEAGTKVNSGSVAKEIDKKSEAKGKSGYSLVKQEDHKLQFMPKPDGKDDQPYEMQATPLEEYFPQPPLAEDKAKETGVGKLIIGQIPFFGSLPFLGPSVFLPDRSFSIGIMSRLPFPPALAVQDRLPMPDAEVMEEGSETAVIENIDPVSGMVRGERRTVAHRFNSPFGPDFTLPLGPMKKSLKELMDDHALKEKSKAQIVDVMGRKMLLQNKVLKYPTDNSGRMYVGVMSVRPLDEVDPRTLKNLGVGNEDKGIDKTHRETEDKIQEEEKRTVGKPILSPGIDKVPINLSKEMKELGFDVERRSEADILKVEESKLEEKRERSDAAVIAQATGITSISKEMVKESETKEGSILDGDLKGAGKEHERDFKFEETNVKKLIDFETETLQGPADKKEVAEAAVKKQETSPENKVTKEPERVSVLKELQGPTDKNELGEGSVKKQETSPENKVVKEHDGVSVLKELQGLADKKELGEASVRKQGMSPETKVPIEPEIKVPMEPERVSVLKELQGPADKKELVETSVKKQETSPENKVPKEPEIVSVLKEHSDKDLTILRDSIVSEDKADQAFEKEGEDLKLSQKTIATKDGETIARKDEIASSSLDISHSMIPFPETGDKEEKLESKTFNGYLEDKDIKVEDIHFTKTDGLLFTESEKKRHHQGKDKGSKKVRKCKYEESEDEDSKDEDSEDED